MTTEGFISLLTLSPSDCVWQQVKDVYSCHRVVCHLFGLHGVEKVGSESSGVQWRLIDGSAHQGVRLLILSTRRPAEPEFGTLEVKAVPKNLLTRTTYRFSIRVNPTKRLPSGKLQALKGEKEITDWFSQKADAAGFLVDRDRLAITGKRVEYFPKGNGFVTMVQFDLAGTLKVTDQDRFSAAFFRGLGRGRAFGCGLLQIVPID